MGAHRTGRLLLRGEGLALHHAHQTAARSRTAGQLPPNFPRDEDRLRATLAVLPAGEKHAFEFWAARIRSWDADAYLYFNNDWEAFAPRNALRLEELLRS